ncbi:AmmeMemoRadiSam system protein A [Chloroflexota bacterium]
MDDVLSIEECRLLLKLARQSLEQAVNGKPLEPLDVDKLPSRLKEQGATFVTLTRDGSLRGCIGTLEPSLPLAEDVREHTVASALRDYRFPPVKPEELSEVKIEISRLTLPQEIDYSSTEDLLNQLHPDIDGVILRDGSRRATFLPQVWSKIPRKEIFMEHLCQKLGAPADLWRSKNLQVFTYQVQEFHE